MSSDASGDSLGPVERPVPGEVRRVRRRLWGTGGIVVLVGALYLWLGGGVASAPGTATAAATQLQAQTLGGFWQCVLPGVEPSVLASNEQLSLLIEERLRWTSAEHGEQTAQRCMGRLGEVREALGALRVPARAEADLAGMGDAIDGLQQAVEEYLRASRASLNARTHARDYLLQSWADYQQHRANAIGQLTASASAPQRER